MDIIRDYGRVLDEPLVEKDLLERFRRTVVLHIGLLSILFTGGMQRIQWLIESASDAIWRRVLRQHVPRPHP